MEKEFCLGFYNTPPLWTKTQFGLPQFVFPQFDMSKFTPQEIPQKLRLGHKMEYVYKQLISHSSQYKVLLHNLPIRNGKQTIGEIDFLLEHKPSKTQYHIELAYKFYIIDPKISEPIHRLIGPNKKDMFYTKLDKLKEKQFPLLYTETLKKNLQELLIDIPNIQQQASFKAQLFLPFGDTTTSIGPLNKNCITGSWLRFDDFNSSPFSTYEYYIPYKQEWAIRPSLNREYTTHYKTLLDLNLRMLKEKAPLLWLKKPDNSIEKVFVVWW